MPKLYAGLDVADRLTAICIVDGNGKVVVETKAETTPEAIGIVLRPHRSALARVGQEAGNLSAWLHKELRRSKYPMECLDARQAHRLLGMRLNKTDANDARGLALLLAKDLAVTTHVKSDEALRIRTVLVVREAVLEKLISFQNLASRKHKAAGAHRQVKKKRQSATESHGQAALNVALESVRSSINALESERRRLDSVIRRLARQIPECKRLMTVPGVGPIAALTYFATIDDPHRFNSSRIVPAYLGLTPRVFQSGGSSKSGGISHRGDRGARKALYHAARSLLLTSRSTCGLRRWGLELARAKGYKIAYVACARKLAVLMHHLWITGQDFDPAR